MVKKYLHHFNRGIVLACEVFGALVLIAAALWLLLIIRLSQGPMNVDYLTKTIESELNKQQTGFVFDVDTTVLTWGGVNQPFELQMKNVQVNRDDNTPVFIVEKIGVQILKRYLVFGRFVPRVIKLHGASLKIIRNETGNFSLNIREGSAVDNKEDVNSDLDVNFLKPLLLKMKETNAFGFIIGLKQIAIKDAALLYEDKILGVSWRSKTSNITFTRNNDGVLVDSLANIEMGEESGFIKGSFLYSWQTLRPSGVLQFTGFNPAVIAQNSLKLKSMSSINLPLKGSVSLEMDKSFKPEKGSFILGADKGSINALDLYKDSVAVTDFYTQGEFNLLDDKVNIEKFGFTVDKSKLEFKADISKADSVLDLKLGAVVNNVPVDSLNTYWPKAVAEDARSWVITNLSKGAAQKATLNTELSFKGEGFKEVVLKSIGGEVDFKGVKVDYFSPLKPVENVSGKAKYDNKSFNIFADKGELGNIKLKDSKIYITDLDIQDEVINSKIDINVSMQGPVDEALAVIDGKPLKYPKKLGLNIKDISGNADIDVNFKFPLHHKLSFPELVVETKAKLTSVEFKNVVSDLSMVKGDMDLFVDSKHISVSGQGLIAGVDTKFKWSSNFSKKAKVVTKLDADLAVDGFILKKFGVDESLNVSGVLPTHITYTVSPNKTSKVILQSDVTSSSFIVPGMFYKKNKGLSGKLNMIAHIDKNKNISRITNLDLSGEGLVLKGNIDFDKKTKNIRKAFFDKLKLGDTDVAVDLMHNVKDGYTIKLTGNQFDASKIINDRDDVNTDEKAAKMVVPFVVSMNVDKLITSKNKYIEKVKMFMRSNEWNRIEHLEVEGVSGGGDLNLRYLPVLKGHTLNFEATNAGAALSALGITDSMRGGNLMVDGVPSQEGGRNMVGTAVIKDFTLVKVPVLGRLLNAISLTGIVELLEGSGISFKRMESNFLWFDEGQPKKFKNTRLLQIKKGRTSGSSLGLTFEGNIDKWSNIINMNGTIVPASGLNKVIGSIPVLGGILTGGKDGGVFAATYTVKGPTDQPTVTVNPLSMLAPGILRKMLFE